MGGAMGGSRAADHASARQSRGALGHARARARLRLPGELHAAAFGKESVRTNAAKSTFGVCVFRRAREMGGIAWLKNLKDVTWEARDIPYFVHALASGRVYETAF